MTMKLRAVLFLFLTTAMAAAARPTPSEPAPDSFIASSCNETRYPEVCIQALNTYAEDIDGDPIRLTHTAVNLTGYNIDGMKNCTTALYKRALELSAPAAAFLAALKDCKDNLGDARSEVEESLGQMKAMNRSDPDLPFHKNNVLTWLSAAMTDAMTCVDGVADAEKNTSAATGFIDDVLGTWSACKNFLVEEHTSISLSFVNLFYKVE